MSKKEDLEREIAELKSKLADALKAAEDAQNQAAAYRSGTQDLRLQFLTVSRLLDDAREHETALAYENAAIRQATMN